MPAPGAGEGFDFDRRLHLKQNGSAVDEEGGLGLDGPGGGGGGEHGGEEHANRQDTDGASPEPPRFARPDSRGRLSPHLLLWFCGRHFISVALCGIVASVIAGMRIRFLGLIDFVSLRIGGPGRDRTGDLFHAMELQKL